MTEVFEVMTHSSFCVYSTYHRNSFPIFYHSLLEDEHRNSFLKMLTAGFHIPQVVETIK